MQPILAKLVVEEDDETFASEESVIVLDVVAAPAGYGHQGMALVATEHYTIEYVTLDRLRWRFIGPDWPTVGFEPDPYIHTATSPRSS